MTNNDELALAIWPLVKRCYQGVSAVKASDGARWTKQPLTDARLRAHVEGKKSRGLAPITPGESMTSVALLDVDDHDGSLGFDELREYVGQLCDALSARGLVPHPWLSSGGNGTHIYMIWDWPQDAYSVRQTLAEALASCELENGTSGLAQGQVEVFPKQDHVPIDGYGNFFILPLAGESVPLEPLLGYEPVSREDVAGYEWTASDPVTVRQRDPVPVSPGDDGVSLTEVASALEWIPNDGDGLDYDEWRDVIFGVHHVDPGPDGYELAEAWSARSSKHDPDFLAERVWPYIRGERSNVITGGTVLRKAREHGWTPPDEVVAEDFEFHAPAAANDDPLTPELPKGLERDNNGAIKATITNVVAMVGHPPAAQCQIAHDKFMGQVMIAEQHGQWRQLRDPDYTELRMRCERWGAKPISREMMRDAVAWVAQHHEMDSAVTWLTQEIPEWDGVSRINSFFPTYFNTDDRKYTRECGRYIWTAMAGRVLSPGCKADMIPVLVGEQGLRKSSGIKSLVPSPNFFFEVDLRASDVDLARQMRGRLVGELDELRGLSKRDVEHVKSFASRSHESWIPKYCEQTYTYPRRCVFIGSTNADEFLVDETGNRRFLPIECGLVDTDAIERDRDQLWAEARELFRQHGVLYRGAEATAAGEHEDYLVQDPWEQAISDWLESESLLDSSTRKGDQPFAMDEVLREALGLGSTQQDYRAANRASSILKRLGYAKKHVRDDGRRLRRWVKVD